MYQLTDSQENVEWVGSNYILDVIEVRDEVSERAPEVVETSPPVLSFAQFCDDLSD